jgi:hypothetical protein
VKPSRALVAALALCCVALVLFLAVRSDDRRAGSSAAEGSSSSLSAGSGRSWTEELEALGWGDVQEPRSGSITLLDPGAAPGSTSPLPPGRIVRVELRDGERTSTSGYEAARAELLGRGPSGSWSGTPASKWPDPPGSVRWYDFSVFVPEDFPFADDTRWFVLTQWKGLRGGSPPVALEVRDTRFYLAASSSAKDLGHVRRGDWNRLTVGIHFSPEYSRGWVQAYRDGQQVLGRTPAVTLDLVNGQPDPVYLKQGIYRSNLWTQTQVLFFAPLQVTSSRPRS